MKNKTKKEASLCSGVTGHIWLVLLYGPICICWTLSLWVSTVIVSSSQDCTLYHLLMPTYLYSVSACDLQSDLAPWTVIPGLSV